MRSLRDILRSELGGALSALAPLDRVTAAWPVVAGHAVAERSSIVRLEQGTTGWQAAASVVDESWLPELRANTPRLAAELARVSGVPVADILFFAVKPATTRP